MKNSIIFFNRAFIVEVLKIKNTLGAWSIIIFPLLIGFINFMIYYSHPEILSGKEADPWITYTRNIVFIWSLLFMPMFIAILTFYINFTDHKANGWKYLYSLPVPKHSIYFSKLFLSVITALFTMLILFTVNYLSIQFISVIHQQIPFDKSNPLMQIALIFMKIWFASLGVLAIQFAVSIIFQNFFIPIGLGIMGVITSAFLLEWENIIYYPYAFPFFAANDLLTGNSLFFTQPVFFGIASGVIIAAAGYFIHSRQEI